MASGPGRGRRNDAQAPTPGFTAAQYDGLALLYVIASVRAGAWLVPAFHAPIDADIRGAQAFGTPPRRDGNGLSATERELLELLSRGLTDEAAGRKLGVSLRTVRRMMADLTTRLGATSRFQAGVRTQQLGWLADARR